MTTLKQHLRDRRLGAAVRVAAALVLFAAIAGDLVADTRCHNVPPESASQAGSLKAPGGRGQVTFDPCGGFCVPDCFCCSQLVAGAPATLLPAVRCSLPIASNGAERWPAGVRPVPYHPPLLTS